MTAPCHAVGAVTSPQPWRMEKTAESVGHPDAGMVSGWHHHGDHETSMNVASGALRLEYGHSGASVLEGHAGDFIHVPRGAIHREGNPTDAVSTLVVVRAGRGVLTVNVDGPEPGAVDGPPIRISEGWRPGPRQLGKKPEFIRWDTIEITDIGVILPSGSSIATNAGTGDTVALSGSGQAEPQDHEAAGGGTFLQRGASGTEKAHGLYVVTGFGADRAQAGRSSGSVCRTASVSSTTPAVASLPWACTWFRARVSPTMEC